MLKTTRAYGCSLQGAVLQSSDRGGIRIQYSKNPFGKKRDAGGNYISTPEPPPGAYYAAPAASYEADGVKQEPVPGMEPTSAPGVGEGLC